MNIVVKSKILVSACLLGENVRYDGKNQKLSHQYISLWKKQDRLLSICPEVVGGLPIPRSPAEINASQNTIINSEGNDVTEPFMRGAQQALALCKKHDIRFALLKESSPSCGSTTIYDGSFSGRKIAGEGITAALLKNNGVMVFSENNIEELIHSLNLEE